MEILKVIVTLILIASMFNMGIFIGREFGTFKNYLKDLIEYLEDIIDRAMK